ncbi:LysR family transcriptional regulator [Uliginosibacterium flavum]|uniref:LysR substrate-binding domain-containing protein n=1 Tax=Uliginosibacterium flavum TaxID=1396831 RepID=A0ABV2TH93_9RHOO
MELRHLRYFLAVAEELHFTRAAARLHIGQPPLSQQIQALEAELGVALFIRTKRSVQLTEAGQHLLVRAREILGASADVADELQRIARGGAGELRIGFTSSGLLIPDIRNLLRHYRAAFPAVSLRLSEMTTHVQFAALQRGELDIGFVRFNESAAPDGIRMQILRQDRLCLVLPEDHRLAGRSDVSLAECQDEAFICYPASIGASVVEYLRRLCAKAGFAPRVAQEAQEALTQIGLVAAGMGIAVLPAPLAVVQISGVRFVPLRDEGAHLIMALATRQKEDSPRVQGFVAAWAELVEAP